MQVREYLSARLPMTPDGEVHLRDVEVVATIRHQEVKTVVPETTTIDRIVDLFGDVLGSELPDGPLPEPTYQALLAKADEIGSPLWRQHWERFRAEGRI